MWLQQADICVLIIYFAFVGVPRLNTPPLSNAPNAVLASNQERLFTAPKPLRVNSNSVNRLEDLSQPWTRSPTKSKMEPVLATWQFVSPDPTLAHGFVIGMFVLLTASSDLHIIYCPFVSMSLIKQQQILLLPGMPCSLLPCLIHMI